MHSQSCSEGAWVCVATVNRKPLCQAPLCQGLVLSALSDQPRAFVNTDNRERPPYWGLTIS